jgi:putative aldouronate transport system substrate-binding protein
MQTNACFCYVFTNKPGSLEQEMTNSGSELYGVQLLPTWLYSQVSWQWAISSASKNPEKTMQLLNLLYTDKEFLNAFIYGEEGKDYVIKDNGTVGFPAGINRDNVGYNMMGSLWQAGNEFNAYVWETNSPDLWERTLKWNEEGNPALPYYTSKAYGFRFDSTSLKNEMAAVSNVYRQYRMALEWGQLDPETALPEMNKKMYDAGLKKILDEKQRQLDVWAKAVGIR